MTNQPLSDLNRYLPQLLAGKCEFDQANADVGAAIRARLLELGAGTLMTCPVIDIQRRLVGVVSITWDADDAAPHGDELQSLTEFALTICAQIAAALDLRGNLPNSDMPNRAG